MRWAWPWAARADRGLVRAGAEQGSVVAEFEPPRDQPVCRRCWTSSAIAFEGELVLRRVVTADGRSRAFVNDEPVSASLLRQVGDLLVEVHGQFDQRGPARTRRRTAPSLDAFGGLERPSGGRARGHARPGARRPSALDGCASELRGGAARGGLSAPPRARACRPRAEPGEEEELAPAAPGPDEPREARGRAAARRWPRWAATAVRSSAWARPSAGWSAAPASAPELLEPARRGAGPGADRGRRGRGRARGAPCAAWKATAARSEQVEERLFALRDAARKHRVPVDALPALLAETRALLERIDAGADDLEAAERGRGSDAQALSPARPQRFRGARARRPTRSRAAVMAELPPLRLERARMRVRSNRCPRRSGVPDGAERVAFEVCTNPGQPFGPIGKIASGGELSRFMLALKVVLARLDTAATLIFDEVDAGIGGATADAVGERLARLGDERQVLVVTHAPQVAARADHHFSVGKRVGGGRTRVEVRELAQRERRDEIARMLAGAEVTDAARAAAAA